MANPKQGALKWFGSIVADTAREIASVPGNIYKSYKKGTLGQSFTPGSKLNQKAIKARTKRYTAKYGPRGK